MDCKHLDPVLRLAAHMAFAPNPERTVDQLGLPFEMTSHIVPPLPDAAKFDPADSTADFGFSSRSAYSVGGFAPADYDMDSDADSDDAAGGGAVALPAAVPGKKPLTILDLNDDCLMVIYEYLDVIDIVHASEAIRGLNEFALRNVYLKFPRLSMNDYHHHTELMYTKWRLMMQHFGPHLHGLVLNAKMLANPTIEAVLFVLRHCAKLSELRLENFKFQGPQDFEAMLEVEPFRPERLELAFCTGLTIQTGFDKVLQKFVNLRSLTILRDTTTANPDESNVNLLMGLHSLEEMILADMHDTDGMLSRVLMTQGGHLKRLTMIDLKPQNLNVLHDLSTSNPNLVELKLHIGPEPSLVRSLHNLSHLKRLQLVDDSERESGNEVWHLRPFDQLEALELSMFHGDLLEAALQVPTLKTLTARCPRVSTDDTIFRTVAGLSNLTSLYLCSFKFEPSAPIRLLRSNTNLREMTLDRCLTRNPSLEEIHEHLTELYEQHPRLPFRLIVISQPTMHWDTRWGNLNVNEECPEVVINLMPVIRLRVKYLQSSISNTGGAHADYIMPSSERQHSRRFDRFHVCSRSHKTTSYAELRRNVRHTTRMAA